MFDEGGDIVPVLVGPEAARVGGDPHYHTFDGNTVHYQGMNQYTKLVLLILDFDSILTS